MRRQFGSLIFAIDEDDEDDREDENDGKDDCRQTQQMKGAVESAGAVVRVNDAARFLGEHRKRGGQEDGKGDDLERHAQGESLHVFDLRS